MCAAMSVELSTVQNHCNKPVLLDLVSGTEVALGIMALSKSKAHVLTRRGEYQETYWKYLKHPTERLGQHCLQKIDSLRHK